MAENSFITSGAPARNTFTSADSSVTISSQFLAIISLSLPPMLDATGSLIDRFGADPMTIHDKRNLPFSPHIAHDRHIRPMGQ